MDNTIKNTVTDVISERRSIRAYTNVQITETELATILESALLAPSARNAQICQIRVMQDQAFLQELNADFVKLVSREPGSERYTEPGYSFYHHAPTMVFILGPEDNIYSYIDGGIMVQNITLCAQSIGLGSCIIGCINRLLNEPEGLKWIQRLEAPEGYAHVIAASIGYKAENPDKKPRDHSRIIKIG